MTDRIEALAREIDPAAWEYVEPPFPPTTQYMSDDVLARKVWLDEVRPWQERKSAARQAARIALGVASIIGPMLKGLMPQDDGK